MWRKLIKYSLHGGIADTVAYYEEAALDTSREPGIKSYMIL